MKPYLDMTLAFGEKKTRGVADSFVSRSNASSSIMGRYQNEIDSAVLRRCLLPLIGFEVEKFRVAGGSDHSYPIALGR
jgi:hypothetical protein